MNPVVKSIRPFIGSKNYTQSLEFYKDLGWETIMISKDMSLIRIRDNFGFYLQDYYNKSWVENTMLFLEIDDVPSYFTYLQSLKLEEKYKIVKLHPIKKEPWGMECFLTDPSGVLWHFGSFL